MLARATALALPFVAGGAIAWVLSGPIGLLGVVLGVTAVAPAAVVAVSGWTTATVVVLAATAAWLGAATGHDAAPAAGLVALAAVAQAPLSMRSAGIGAMLPVVVAIGVSVPLSEGGWASPAWILAAWTLAGGGLAVVVGRIARIAVPPQPVRAAVARRHAAIVAVAVGTATALTVQRGVTHGYWLVLTLAVVLRPVRRETAAGARDRALGTVAGIGAAVAIVVLLPALVAGVVALGCLLVSIAWALVGDLRRQTLFTTPVVVLFSSSGVTGAAFGLAAERLLFTLVGAVVAVGAAVLLARWDGISDGDEDALSTAR